VAVRAMDSFLISRFSSKDGYSSIRFKVMVVSRNILQKKKNSFHFLFLLFPFLNHFLVMIHVILDSMTLKSSQYSCMLMNSI
jgi:hypothetical protein